MDKVQNFNLGTLMLRPRLLMSAELSNRNSILKLMTYNRFIDIKQSATIAEDMLESMWELIRKEATGAFNVVNTGVISPLDIAKILNTEIGAGLELNEITKEELDSFTRVRRIRTVLSTKRLESQGIHLKDIRERVCVIACSLKDGINSERGQQILQKTFSDTKEKLRAIA
jgi:dTDP-4-dehydrorhamnose reductase